MQQNESMNKKDWWDKVKILTEIIIAVLIFVFTQIYNKINSENATANLQLSRSNSKLSETHLKSSLVPYLSNQNPRVKPFLHKS